MSHIEGFKRQSGRPFLAAIVFRLPVVTKYSHQTLAFDSSDCSKSRSRRERRFKYLLFHIDAIFFIVVPCVSPPTGRGLLYPYDELCDAKDAGTARFGKDAGRGKSSEAVFSLL